MNELLTLTKRTVDALNSIERTNIKKVDLCGFCHKPQYVTHPEQTDLWHCDHCKTYNVVE